MSLINKPGQEILAIVRKKIVLLLPFGDELSLGAEGGIICVKTVGEVYWLDSSGLGSTKSFQTKSLKQWVSKWPYTRLHNREDKMDPCAIPWHISWNEIINRKDERESWDLNLLRSVYSNGPPRLMNGK